MAPPEASRTRYHYLEKSLLSHFPWGSLSLKQTLLIDLARVLALPLTSLLCRGHKAQLLQHTHGILLEPFFDDFAFCKAEDVHAQDE